MEDSEIGKRAWDIIRAHLESATPAQWHLFAAGSNYDDNALGLRWLIDNPNVDRATALLIYWALGVAWYVQFSSEDEMHDDQVKTFELLQLIEQRYSEHFYANHCIWFDPKHWHGPGPNDYPELAIKRPIPAIMLESADSSEYVDIENPEGYDDGLPLEISEQWYALYD